MEKTPQQKDFFEYAKEALPLVVVVCSVIFSWAYFQFTVSALEDRVTAIETARVADVTSISQISGDIKAINSKLDLIINGKIK